MFYRILFAIVIFCLGITVPIAAQQPRSAFGDEPMPDLLGAPLYPGAEFIRIIDSIDTQYITAMYISLVPFEIVEDFFKRKLVEKRVIMYDDDEIYLTTFLLKTWSQFPFDPSREEISNLQREPSVQIQYYDPHEYEALAEYFDDREDGDLKSLAIRRGETMILYTYERPKGPSGAQRLVGSWKESSRDLEGYWNSVMTFHADGTYTYQATAENITGLASDPFIKTHYRDTSEQELVAILNDRNPETGTYSVLGSTIILTSEHPIDGMEKKSGLLDAGTVSMSLELVNKPRLTFIKMRESQ